MKSLFLVFGLMISMSVFALEENYSSEEKVYSDVPPVSIEQILEYKSDPKARCYAWTICPSGRRISCYAYGNSCTWYYIAGRLVRCTGHNNWGRWVSFTYRCY